MREQLCGHVISHFPYASKMECPVTQVCLRGVVLLACTYSVRIYLIILYLLLRSAERRCHSNLSGLCVCRQSVRVACVFTEYIVSFVAPCLGASATRGLAFLNVLYIPHVRLCLCTCHS